MSATAFRSLGDSVQRPVQRPVPGRPRAGRPETGRVLGTRWLAIFLGGHLVLGALMRVVPALATVHAIACIAVGVVFAVTRRPRDVAFMVAYIAGSEVLWRMTRAGVFHELGKYAISLMLLIALSRMRGTRNRLAAAAYLGLLLPSAALTFSAVDFDEARRVISFNLSGPLALMLCVMYFSNARLTGNDVRRVFVAFIGPALAIASLVFLSTAAISSLQFGGHSNRATSGGFGPNQVSAILGLGLLFAVLMLFERTLRWRLRVPLVAVAIFLAVEAALTFSRGGLAFALAGALAAMMYLMRDARKRVTVLVLAALLFGVGNYIVVPQLEAFTQGKIIDRYTRVDSTGRTDIAGVDLQIFQANPVMGVGPGLANDLRGEIGGRTVVAHTEFTRMLAEHGMLGALAILMLVLIGIGTFRTARTLEARAYVVAMLVWAGLFFAVDGMRVVAPAFLCGLACAIAFSSTPIPVPRPRST